MINIVANWKAQREAVGMHKEVLVVYAVRAKGAAWQLSKCTSARFCRRGCLSHFILRKKYESNIQLRREAIEILKNPLRLFVGEKPKTVLTKRVSID